MIAKVGAADCTGALASIVRTVEFRLADCRGIQWRHGHKALLLLRGLALFGPPPAVAHALDLLDHARMLRVSEWGWRLGDWRMDSLNE